jgi:dTDP-4-dehydrorhamnose 3,5-epimerase-like enzyme
VADRFPQIDGLKVVRVPEFRDARGVLFPLESHSVIPFCIKRLFWITDVPAGTIRGAHAHKVSAQFYICCRGQVDVKAWDGRTEAAFTLRPGEAIHIPAMIFSTEIFAGPDSVLMVASDHSYDKDDYLHTPESYLSYLDSAAISKGVID